ncbi:adenylate kinase family protein [Cytobacillus praedii]|uniref:adenylate kinase family protein n=1 Tax=Cytobacillus praedii TaxID=1742358 RepID=UPI003AF6D2F8
MTNAPKILLLGPPASGKSTLFKNIKDLYPNIGHFAVRLFFEKEKKLNSNWHKRAVPDKDGWLPDHVVAEAAEMEIVKKIKDGFIVEGFPASKNQAILFQNILDKHQIVMNGIIYLTADKDISIARSKQRLVCLTCDNGVNHVEPISREKLVCPICDSSLTSRIDDSEEGFNKRLKLHHERIMDIFSILDIPKIEISGELPKKEVLARAIKFIGLK